MKHFAFSFLLLFAAEIAGGQTYVSGTLLSNTVWDIPGSPYVVTGNVMVSPGITLAVDSGVVVQFQNNQGLYVRGNLVARHTLFTSAGDTVGGTPAKGDWASIQIGDGSGSGTATFDTCRIRYGGGYWFPADNANLYVYWGTATLGGCDISSGNNYGIMLYSLGAVTMSNSSVFSCDWPVSYVGQGSLIFTGSNNLTGNTHNGINMRFSSNDNHLTLDTANVPYAFLSGFTVITGGILEIASTNMIKFGPGTYLSVNGTLIAEGGIGQRIYFTAYTDDNVGGDTNADGTATSPASSYWGAIAFNDPSVDIDCVLRRCKVAFAGAGNIGGISMFNASPRIDSCEMASNYFGAMIQGVSNPVFSNNIIGSSVLVPIALSFDASPVFTDNVFSFSDNRYDAVGLLGGTLLEDATIRIRSVTTIPNVTYLMLGDLIVPPGRTLTINKGVVIKAIADYFTGPPRLVVQGKLVAIATADSMITITSARDDNYGNPFDTNKDGTQTAPNKGDWGGITFEATSDTNSILDYCRVKYGSLPYVYYNTRYISGGEITTVNASPTVSHCEIRDVVYGIYAFQASNPKLVDNSIINSQYTPIAMSVSANPTLVGNSFTNTTLTALGIIGENLGVSGTIPRRTVGGFSNITYLLLEDLTINAGTNVTVDPGVVVKCNGTGIFVNGGFRARGTVANGRITFTSIKDDNEGNPFDTNGDGAATSPAKGDWQTIRFQATSDDAFCLLDSSTIKYAGSSGWGGVTFTDASGTISNVTITDSYDFGVKCEGNSLPVVDRADLRNCRRDPIGMSLLSDPSFTNITFTSNGSLGIRIIEGTLSSNARLRKRDVAGINNIAYIIETVTIGPNAILSIDPGVVIKFPLLPWGPWGGWVGAGAINVQGALAVMGTATQKVVFTSMQDDSRGGDTNNDGNSTSPNRGDWAFINFTNSGIDTLNLLRNCEISYSGSGYYGSYGSIFGNWGAIAIVNSQTTIDSCIIQHSSTSGVGVYGSATPNIQNCLVSNIANTPIMMSMFSDPVFANNTALNVGYMALGIVPETYSQNATVPKRNFGGYNNITYLLFSSGHRINSGTTITIPAGVVFKGEGNMQVDGALVVSGTPAEKVVFTDPRDDTFGNPGDTNGDGSATQPSFTGYARLTFSDVSDDSVSSLRYTVFRYGDAGIDLAQASPKILHCQFDEDNWGIRLTGVSQPIVDSCAFNNLTFSPLRISLVSYPRSTNGNTISGTTYRGIEVNQEVLAQDITLTKRTFAGIRNIPYLFRSYTVGTGATLTIEPGAILKFWGGGQLAILKGLIAEGGSHPDSTTVFTDWRDDFYGGDTNADTTATVPDPNFFSNYSGNWLGISFPGEALDPLCRLTHCVVRFAGTWWSNQYGGINATSASPTILHSVISRNKTGIVADAAANPIINYCDIYQNTLAGITNTNQSFNIDARWNWWGNNTGPTHAGNPGGTGDVVTDSVNYLPFRAIGAQTPVAGDVSLNGRVQAYDASLVLRFVVDSLSNPLNEIQKRVADVSGVSGITSYDASLILQYVAGKIQVFPIEVMRKTRELMQLPQVQASSVEIGSATCKQGTTVTIPVKMRDVQNLSSVDIVLTFDGELLVPRSVVLAPVLSQMNVSTHYYKGKVNVAIAGAVPVTANEEVLYVTFDVAKGISGTPKSAVGFAKLLLNEVDFSAMSQSGEVSIIGKPTAFALEQNYPNPFNPTTTIGFQIPEEGTHVRILIYDVLGKSVKKLVDEIKGEGAYRAPWDGRNDAGNYVGSGVYFYRMTAQGTRSYEMVRTMILVR